MRRSLAALLLLLGLAPALAREGLPVAPPQPIILRLEGHFAPDRDAAGAHGADAVSIRVDDVERWFSTVRARTLGDHPLDGRDVLATLAPIRPNLIAVGADDLRKQLRDAPTGMPVEVEGLVNRGSRTYLLRAVIVGTPPAP